MRVRMRERGQIALYEHDEGPVNTGYVGGFVWVAKRTCCVGVGSATCACQRAEFGTCAKPVVWAGMLEASSCAWHTTYVW